MNFDAEELTERIERYALAYSEANTCNPTTMTEYRAAKAEYIESHAALKAWIARMGWYDRFIKLAILLAVAYGVLASFVVRCHGH
jgi:hypothetical protein